MKLCMGCMSQINDHTHICPLCGYAEGTPPSEAYYLIPGTELGGRYILGKVLGYGGFGITYIGYDTLLQMPVAVKEFFPSYCVTRSKGQKNVTAFSGNTVYIYKSGLESFVAEAKRLAQLQNTDGVVQIYDCILENNTGYIVMEYLRGKTVREILSEQRQIPYNDARRIIVKVLEALEFVHKEGIIHRDIAPDNIFITDQGEVKLIDFGAARYDVSLKSHSLTRILKPGFAPEEQYRSGGRQGPWTDVYAVGASFYRMITGKRPPESIERMTRDELVPPSMLGIEISPKDESVLLKAMAIKGEDRFQTAGEFRTMLLKRPEEIENPGGGSHRNVISATLIGFAAGLVIGGGLLAILWRGNGKTEQVWDNNSEVVMNQDGSDYEQITDHGEIILERETPTPVAATPTPTPTPKPKPTATSTPTPKPTATSTPTPKPTATSTPTPKPTAASTPTPEPTATSTPAPERSDDYKKTSTDAARQKAIVVNMEQYLENSTNYSVFIEKLNDRSVTNEIVCEPENLAPDVFDKKLNNLFVTGYVYKELSNERELPNDDNVLKSLCLQMNGRSLEGLEEDEKITNCNSGEARDQILSRMGFADSSGDLMENYKEGDRLYIQDGRNLVNKFANSFLPDPDTELHANRSMQVVSFLKKVFAEDGELWQGKYFVNLKNQLRTAPGKDAKNSKFTKYILQNVEVQNLYDCLWIEDMKKQGKGVYAAFLFLPKWEDEKEDAYVVVVCADTLNSTGQTELAEDIADYVCGKEISPAPTPSPTATPTPTPTPTPVPVYYPDNSGNTFSDNASVYTPEYTDNSGEGYGTDYYNYDYSNWYDQNNNGGWSGNGNDGRYADGDNSESSGDFNYEWNMF